MSIKLVDEKSITRHIVKESMDFLIRASDIDVAEFLGVNTLEGVIKDVNGDIAQIFSKGFGEFINVKEADGMEKGTKVLITFRSDDVVILAGPFRTRDLSTTEAIIENVYVIKCNIKLTLRLAGGA
mgnify:CR=1 FL=1